MYFELEDYSFVDSDSFENPITVKHTMVVDRDRCARLREPFPVHVDYDFFRYQEESDRAVITRRIKPFPSPVPKPRLVQIGLVISRSTSFQQGRLGGHRNWRLSYGPVVQPG